MRKLRYLFRKLRILLPHLCVAFNIAMLVVVILAHYNPLMDLMRGGLFNCLVFGSALSAVATAYNLIIRRGWR